MKTTLAVAVALEKALVEEHPDMDIDQRTRDLMGYSLGREVARRYMRVERSEICTGECSIDEDFPSESTAHYHYTGTVEVVPLEDANGSPES